MKTFLSVFVSAPFISFYKRTVILAGVSLIGFLITNISKFGFSTSITAIVGLGLGEFEQYLESLAPVQTAGK